MRFFNQLSYLDRAAWVLLVESGLFAIATALSSIFINVFLWKIQNDYRLIAWFNIAHYLISGITFVVAGWFSKRMARVALIRLGVLILALFYLTIWLLGKNAIHYVYGLGALLGLGSGLFWLSFNVLYFEITEKENRDIFNSLNGSITSFAGITAPFISGLIISKVGSLAGYQWVFGLSLMIFGLAVVVSFFFKDKETVGDYHLMRVLRGSRKRTNHWYWVNMAMVAQGLREGVFSFLISLLFYVITKSEFVLGTYSMITSIVALLSYFWLSQRMRPSNRNNYMFWGTFMMGLSVVPFIIDTSAWAIWLLGIGTALFYPFYITPLTSKVFDVIGEDDQNAQLRVEFVVVRELALNFGRIAGILLFIWWVSQSALLEHLRWFLLVFGFAPMLVWLAMRQIPFLETSVLVRR